MKENKFNKILTIASDWIILVIVTNFLIISTSLLIVTILPSMTAGYSVFKDRLNKDSENVFKAYFRNFKENILNKIIVGTGTLILIGIAALSNYYYQETIRTAPTIFAYFGFFITLIMGVAVVLVFLYFPVSFTLSDKMEIEQVVKLSFLLSGKYFIRSIAMLIIFLIPGLMFLSSLTMLLLVFCGISLPLLVNTILLVKPREYITGEINA